MVIQLYITFDCSSDAMKHSKVDPYPSDGESGQNPVLPVTEAAHKFIYTVANSYKTCSGDLCLSYVIYTKKTAKFNETR